MGGTLDRLASSPLRLAAGYGLFGVLWVGFSDWILLVLFDDQSLIASVQTVKGWLFVFLSTVLVYGLVSVGQRELKQTNERLDAALQQTSILDRILRHNLRNSCNVIQAHAQMIAEESTADEEACIEKIKHHNEVLIELGEKSRALRGIVLSDSFGSQQIDLAATIRSQVVGFRESHPDAEISTDLPETLWIDTDARIDSVVYELLENAIEHNEQQSPTVDVTAGADADGTATVEITDDGPGLPDTERQVLDTGFETQMAHSQGLGLWIARTIVSRLGGEFTVTEQSEGTTVTFTLPSSTDGSPPKGRG